MKSSTLAWIALYGIGAYFLFYRRGSAAYASANAVPPMTAEQHTQAVMAAQRVLRDLGLYPGPIDGIAGTNTQAAASAYAAERPALRDRLAAISDPVLREYQLAMAIINRSST